MGDGPGHRDKAGPEVHNVLCFVGGQLDVGVDQRRRGEEHRRDLDVAEVRFNDVLEAAHGAPKQEAAVSANQADWNASKSR